MRFNAVDIEGVWLIEPEIHRDERGLFARVYDEELFAAHGLPTVWPQHNLSENRRCGTLRGMHYQKTPHEEPKIVSCVRGRVFDVVVDLRSGSPTYKRWVGYELSAENNHALYIPAGCAHGFLTLEDNSVLHYLMGARYAAASVAGVRWDDPVFSIAWPFDPVVISPRDASWPEYAL